MSDVRIQRLKELAHAVADRNLSVFTMRVPAEPDRDADLVISWAAREIERLRSELAECRQALRDVINPLGKIQRENPGAKINGAACVSLFGDPQYYKDIARAALAKGEA